MGEIIRGFDTVICDKASKDTVSKLANYSDDTYI